MAQAAVVLRRDREKERLRRERDQLIDIRNSEISISGVGRRGSTPDILHNHTHVTFQNNKQSVPQK